MTRPTRLLALVALAAVAAPALSDDDKLVENPEFKNWAKFKPGTVLVMKNTNDIPGAKSEVTITRKLVEVKEDKLVIEVEMTLLLNSKPAPGQPPTKTELRKEVKASELKSFTWAQTGLPPEATEDGTEKVKVGGTEYECKRYKFKSKYTPPGGKEEEGEGQVWVSDDVPGRIVKVTGKSKSTAQTIEVTQITVKK